VTPLALTRPKPPSGYRQAVISRRLRRSLPPAAASRRQGHFVQLEPRFADSWVLLEALA